uniref:Uncharacterized protein n=1 Tax=Arundo donax TaxID=35708 RepID=A0A0A9BWC0_ARUDO
MNQPGSKKELYFTQSKTGLNTAATAPSEVLNKLKSNRL